MTKKESLAEKNAGVEFGRDRIEDMNVLVTGGAGVIGSSLVRRIPGSITVLDDLSSGSYNAISDLAEPGRIEFIRGDVRDQETVFRILRDKDLVIHLAANADVRYTSEKGTDLDLNTNVIGTYNILEGMRKNDVQRLIFSSSSSVYGYAGIIPTPETYGPLIPESLYAGSKLAAEGTIMSFAKMFDLSSWIFRFANIVAPSYRSIGKNVIPDLILKLRKDKNHLEILGDGNQEKSYLYVTDCIDGMLYLSSRSKKNVDVFNLGNEDSTTVKEIAKVIVEEMGLKDVEFLYTGGSRGWKGDVSKTILDITKARKMGWNPVLNSAQAVRESARNIISQLQE